MLAGPLPHVLAFGLELEYLFPPDASPATKFEDLQRRLEANGLPTRFFSTYSLAHDTSHTNWKLVPDISLIGPQGGFEFVSPILSDTSDWRSAIEQALYAMKSAGAALSPETDFHVHVNATGADIPSIRRVYKNFLSLEPVFDLLQPPNHRGPPPPPPHPSTPCPRI